MTNATDTSTGIVVARGSMPLLGHPDDVRRHPGVSVAEKREILARWASDAHALENAPSLRQLDDGSVVEIDDILQALRTLDEEVGSAAAGNAVRKAHARRRGTFLSRLQNARRRRDDDDDPPPCPASSAYPLRILVADAVAA